MSNALYNFTLFDEMHRKMDGEDNQSCTGRNTKRVMNGNNKSSANRTGPRTERNVSGCNWEILKHLVSEPAKAESNSGKGSSQKKSNSHHPKSTKKFHPAISNVNHIAHVSFDNDAITDENKKKLTKQIALDCEMVGIGDGMESMIARVSLVNRHGYCVYDKYVKAREVVRDYRTAISGIQPHHLQNGEEFDVVQKEVAEILKGRILVGHALKHDLDVLFLSHPRKHLRDTSRYKVFRQLSRGNIPSLKKLANELLGCDIQTGEHSSVEDARAAMQLYMLYKNKWESELYSKY
ncbi:hypothetical protein KM043_000409 [Ampulex compressa]|nr:hypothetical protein KM043_000409 [Ampulex compressa]